MQEHRLVYVYSRINGRVKTRATLIATNMGLGSLVLAQLGKEPLKVPKA